MGKRNKEATSVAQWALDVAKLPIPDDAKEAATIALGCLSYLRGLSAVAKDGPQDDAGLAKYGEPLVESLKVFLVHSAAGEKRRAGEKVRKYAAEYLQAKTLFAGLPCSNRTTAHEAIVDEATGTVVLWERGRWADEDEKVKALAGDEKGRIIELRTELRRRLLNVDWLPLRAAIVKEAAAVKEGTADDESNYIPARRPKEMLGLRG